MLVKKSAAPFLSKLFLSQNALFISVLAQDNYPSFSHGKNK
jgi:hypothetical protein